jgi:type IV pilus assembly protein PilO
MATLGVQRSRFRAAAVVLAAISLLAFLYLISPFTRSSAEKQQELVEKQSQLRAVEDQTRPLQKLPELVTKARADIAAFYADRLPAYPSTVYNEVNSLARKNNVTVAQVKYDVFDLPVPSLKVLQAQAQVRGSYPDLVKFINSVERSKMFFVIESLQIGESQKNASIQLRLTMVTYLRPHSPNEKPEVASVASQDDEEEDSVQ